MSKKKFIYENVEILNVVDGDTVDVIAEVFFDTYKKLRVRLYGINAPETKSTEREQGLRSKEYVKELLPKGSIAKMECLGQDKYGRWLAIIHKDDMIINQHLVEYGYAKEYML